MDYVVLYNDGNLNAQDIRLECVKDGWVPVLVLRDKDDRVTVPMFKDPETAYKFMCRNLSSKVIRGTMNLFEKDIESMIEKGWEIEYMDFPRRFTNHSDYKIDLEIIEVNKEKLGLKVYRSFKQFRG